jgi:hypothetical protein
MEEKIKGLVEKINEEIKASGVPDIIIKKALINFVDSYKTIPEGDAAKIAEDNAAIELLESILGGDNPAIHVYIDFYNAAKRGEASIE